MKSESPYLSLLHPLPSGTAQGLFSVLTAVGNTAPVVVGAFAGDEKNLVGTVDFTFRTRYSLL